MIFGMGVTELAIILAIALLIFSPKSLPKIGLGVGKTVKNVRKGFEDEGKEVDSIDVVLTSDEKPCPACGSLNPSQSAYCAKCGIKL